MNTHLPSWHYASHWPTLETHRPASELTELGIRYVQASDEEKEDLNLELLRAFHPYLYKYLDMIVRGHVPRYGANRINEDTRKLLMTMMPKGTPVNLPTLVEACKHLHLAFKGYEPAEIYNVLATCLLRVIGMYNPFYVEKVKLITDAINTLLNKKSFTIFEIDRATGISSKYVIRMLVKKGHLLKTDDIGARGNLYSIENWPPPESLFNQGPIGLPYYVSQAFRFEFKKFVFQQMRQLENKEEVLQLDHRKTSDFDLVPSHERAFYSPDGGYSDNRGRKFQANTDMLLADWDLSTMTADWVAETNDALFKDLSRKDRLLLMLVYRGDLDWKEIGSSIGMSPKEAKDTHDFILDHLRFRAAA